MGRQAEPERGPEPPSGHGPSFHAFFCADEFMVEQWFIGSISTRAINWPAPSCSTFASCRKQTSWLDAPWRAGGLPEPRSDTLRVGSHLLLDERGRRNLSGVCGLKSDASRSGARLRDFERRWARSMREGGGTAIHEQKISFRSQALLSIIPGGERTARPLPRTSLLAGSGSSAAATAVRRQPRDPAHPQRRSGASSLGA